jgi:hypothetical protein
MAAIVGRLEVFASEYLLLLMLHSIRQLLNYHYLRQCMRYPLRQISSEKRLLSKKLNLHQRIVLSRMGEERISQTGQIP